MKKMILLFAALTFAGMAFGQKTETRNVSGFTGIDASSVFNITLSKGNAESLTIEADDNVMQYVRSEVTNGVLRLFLADKSNLKVKTLNAKITMKSLDRLKLSGACKLTTNDVFTSNDFDGEFSGASNANLGIKSGHLDLEISGASNIVFKAEVSGNSEVEVSGASRLNLTLNTQEVDFDISGTAKISLTGQSERMEVDMSGASNLQGLAFTVKSVSIEASGATNVELSVKEAIKTDMSGSSRLSYKGAPSSVQVNNSGASSVKKID